MKKDKFFLKRKGVLYTQFQKNQSGFTLIEILVSILILGLGAIAMLGLQVMAVKSGVDARYQSTALQLASDLSGMMRSNPTVASIDNSSRNPYLMSSNSRPGSIAAGSGLSSRSNAENIASADIAQWYARVYDSLPGARVTVCFDSNPYDGNGAPQWGCQSSGATPYIKIGWSLRQGASAIDQEVPGVVVPVGVCNPLNSGAAVACVSGVISTP
jgi:type IV pilus assembly protein PilV